MDIITLPILILISIPQAILIAFLGLRLLGIRPTLKQAFLVGIFQAFCSYFIRLIPLNFGFITLLQLISFSIVIYLIVLIPFKISFLTILLGLSIYASIEVISVSLLIRVTGLSIQTVLENNRLRLAFFLPEAIIMVLIILLINHFKINMPELWLNKVSIRKSVKKYYPLVTFFLLQLLLIAVFYLIIEKNERFILKSFLSVDLFVLTLFIVMPITIILMVKSLVTNIEREVEIESQLFTLRHMEDLLKTIRAQRHNFNHDLQVTYGLLEVEAFQEAKDYIRSGMKEIVATSELVKTDNLGITALLHAKMGVSEGRNIELKVSINTSVNKLPINTRDANIILGNLIDNALETVENITGDKKEVKVVLGQDLDGFIFEVIDNGKPIEPEVIHRIFEAGFSTKGQGRGMGLYGVKKILDKYHGNIKVTSNVNSTSFKVSIPL